MIEELLECVANNLYVCIQNSELIEDEKINEMAHIKIGDLICYYQIETSEGPFFLKKTLCNIMKNEGYHLHDLAIDNSRPKFMEEMRMVEISDDIIKIEGSVLAALFDREFENFLRILTRNDGELYIAVYPEFIVCMKNKKTIFEIEEAVGIEELPYSMCLYTYTPDGTLAVDSQLCRQC